MTSQEHSSFRQTWLTDLVSGSGAYLLRFLTFRVKDSSTAADLAQEVYLRLLRVDDLKSIREPRAFALRIAANVAFEWGMLARNRMPHSEDMLEEIITESQAGDPVASAMQAQDMASLHAALNSLTPKCRAVVLLHRRDGMTCQKIAKQLNISVGMVKKYLAKGLMVCREHLLTGAPGSGSGSP